MADEFTGFTREAFTFWKGLERNNNRQWFQGHKEQYEQAVRRPIAAADRRIGTTLRRWPVVTHQQGHAVPEGEAVRAILRRHLGGSYVSLSKDGLWVGTGIYKPEPAVLRQLREAMAGDTSGRELTKIIASLQRTGLEVDTHARLEKPPRGYEVTHPRADLLRMKDIYVGRLFGPDEVASPIVLRGVVKAMSDLEPFRVWLRKNLPRPAAR